MNPKSRFAVYLFAITLFFAGCATWNIELDKEDVPIAVYISARAAFNSHLETYLNYRSVLPNGPEKQALRDKYEPKFEKAKVALDAWGSVLDIGTDPTSAANAYSELIDALVLELIQSGILDGV